MLVIIYYVLLVLPINNITTTTTTKKINNNIIIIKNIIHEFLLTYFNDLKFTHTRSIYLGINLKQSVVAIYEALRLVPINKTPSKQQTRNEILGHNSSGSGSFLGWLEATYPHIGRNPWDPTRPNYYNPNAGVNSHSFSNPHGGVNSNSFRSSFDLDNEGFGDESEPYERRLYGKNPWGPYYNPNARPNGGVIQPFRTLTTCFADNSHTKFWDPTRPNYYSCQ